ncbi:hypothetical protein SPM88_24640 [Enterobacter hormaechei subsp. hoffmannii]
MSTITRERVKDILEFGAGRIISPITDDEIMELARITLASLEAEKSILYRERNPYNGMTTGWQDLTEQEHEFIKDKASENAEFLTVYTAPPTPVIQETADREMLKRLAVILSGSDAPGEIRSLTVTARSFVERCKTLAKERDECRAAMLQSANGNSQVITDWQAEAEKLAEFYGICFVVFRNGEPPRCADPTKVWLGYDPAALQQEDKAKPKK